MKAKAQHLQTLGTALLAMATAAVGFGLLQNTALAPTYAELLAFPQWAGIFAWGKVGFGIAAIVLYFIVVVNVRRMWSLDESITMNEIIQGPLFFMITEMGALTVLFIFSALSVAIR